MRIEPARDLDGFSVTHAWLRAHNERFAPGDRHPVRLFAYDDADELAGSLDGVVFWGKLHVDNLVVRPDCRKQGIGAALMRRAEEIAAKAGCTGVHLDTMSFQALGFYERLGYTEFGRIDGCAGGATRHYLHKPL